jgi:hypothetical protein
MLISLQEGADILHLRHRIEHSISTAVWLKPVSQETTSMPTEVQPPVGPASVKASR